MLIREGWWFKKDEVGFSKGVIICDDLGGNKLFIVVMIGWSLWRIWFLRKKLISFCGVIEIRSLWRLRGVIVRRRVDVVMRLRGVNDGLEVMIVENFFVV